MCVSVLQLLEIISFQICMCIRLCVSMFPQNLDNCHVFSIISLQFSIVNIFLSFRRYIQFHSNSSEIWERKKERKRGRAYILRRKNHKFIEICWCFSDLISQEVCFGELERFFINLISQEVCVGWNREMKSEKFFILDSITQGSFVWTRWVFAVTFGCRSWCDCQNCEMRERDEK